MNRNLEKEVQMLDFKNQLFFQSYQNESEDNNKYNSHYNGNQVNPIITFLKRQSLVKYSIIIVAIGVLITYIIKSIEFYQLNSECKIVQFQNSELDLKKSQLAKKNQDLQMYFEEVTEQYNAFKDEKKGKKQMLNQILYPYITDIIKSPEELKTLRHLLKDDGKVGLRLRYQAKEGIDTSAKFHECTYKIKNTLILIETTQGVRFGGFTTLNFNPETYVDFTISLTKRDKESFVFSFDKNKKWFIDPLKSEQAIYCNENLGPYFGENDISINSPFFDNVHRSLFPKAFQANPEDQLALTNGAKYFKIDHFEVYQVFFPEDKK